MSRDPFESINRGGEIVFTPAPAPERCEACGHPSHPEFECPYLGHPRLGLPCKCNYRPVAEPAPAPEPSGRKVTDAATGDNRLTDERLRELFLSPLYEIHESTAAVVLRMEVVRARASEDTLRELIEDLEHEQGCPPYMWWCGPGQTIADNRERLRLFKEREASCDCIKSKAAALRGKT